MQRALLVSYRPLASNFHRSINVLSLEAVPTDGYLALLPALEPSHWRRGPTPVGFTKPTRLSPYDGERVAAVPEATAFP